MRNLIMEMNVSLDGCADHRVAIADDELHDFAAILLDDVDIALFGRVTYELMASYWPHAAEDSSVTESMINFANKFNAIPKIVFSSTLERVEWNNTIIDRRNVVDEVIKLKQKPGKALSIGGISVSQELIRHGLIDEFWILVHPVIWGKGKRLFDNLERPIKLELVDASTFKSGVVVLHYRRQSDD